MKFNINKGIRNDKNEQNYAIQFRIPLLYLILGTITTILSNITTTNTTSHNMTGLKERCYFYIPLTNVIS